MAGRFSRKEGTDEKSCMVDLISYVQEFGWVREIRKVLLDPRQPEPRSLNCDSFCLGPFLHLWWVASAAGPETSSHFNNMDDLWVAN